MTFAMRARRVSGVRCCCGDPSCVICASQEDVTPHEPRQGSAGVCCVSLNVDAILSCEKYCWETVAQEPHRESMARLLTCWLPVLEPLRVERDGPSFASEC